MTDAAQITAAVQAAETRFGHIDVLVNNAGIGYFAAVEEGGFRTDWAGRSADESQVRIADYAATAGAGRAGVWAVSGHQAGDPVHAVEAIIKAVAGATPRITCCSATTPMSGPSSSLPN